MIEKILDKMKEKEDVLEKEEVFEEKGVRIKVMI